MYKFNDKMSNGNGLQGLTCLAAPFWNLLGLSQHVYNLGNHLVITIKNVTYIYLLASMH